MIDSLKQNKPNYAEVTASASVLRAKDDYQLLNSQLLALLTEERNPFCNLSQFSALVFQSLSDLNWAGFYLADKNNNLRLGPFQGKVACSPIKLGSGVCGLAAAEQKSIVVEDVDKFPGHIVCDSLSRSELVCPVMQGDQFIGVFDLDSPLINRFSEIDKEGINTLIKSLIANTDCSLFPLD